MKIRNLAMIAAVFVGLSQIAGAAHAQAKVYVVNEDIVRRDSKIGKDIASKLGEIKNEGVTKLGLEKLQTEIKTEDDALKPQTQSLSREALAANPTLKARVEALNKKKTEYMQKAEALNSTLGQTNEAATIAFAQALGPAVDYVAKEAGADVVLSFSSTWYVREPIDLSKKIIARLDATMPSLAAFQAAQPKPPAVPGKPATN
jgi:Skp family chaperone for outer membrane proteins